MTTTVQSAYERIARKPFASDGVRPGGLHLIRRILTFLNLGPRPRIADVGCGTGVTVEYLVHERELNAIGVDFNVGMVTKGNARRRSLPLLVGDSGALPFPDALFDLVCMECALSLVSHVSHVLNECRRVLKPRGYFMVSDVYARNPLALAGLRSLPVRSCLKEAFDPQEFMDECSRAGFQALLWEDHSSLLKEFAVQVIWHYGSLAPFFKEDEETPGDAAACDFAIKEARPGYFLYVGQCVPKDPSLNNLCAY